MSFLKQRQPTMLLCLAQHNQPSDSPKKTTHLIGLADGTFVVL